MKVIKKVFPFLLLSVVLALSSCSKLGEDIIKPLPQEDDNNSADNNTPEEIKFTNPIHDADELIWDPTILKDGDSYYAYSVEENWLNGDRPKVGMFKSTDMINWTFVDAAVDPAAGGWLRGIDVFKTADKYVMYIFDDNISYFVADSPEGPFVKEGSFTMPDGIALGADAFANFFEVEGKKYLVTIFDSGIGMIALDDYKTITAGAQPIILTSEEGLQNPSIVAANDSYYLFAKKGNYWDDAEIRVLKSDSPEGPYVDKDGATAGSKVLGPGSQLKHVNGINKIFTDANNEFWVYYSAGTAADGNLQRLCLDKLLFGEDGFPYISGYAPSTSEQVAPKLN